MLITSSTCTTEFIEVTLRKIDVFVCQYSRVLSELVEVIVHVERVRLSQMNEFLQSLVDENDADEGSEGFLCESCDVTHQ